MCLSIKKSLYDYYTKSIHTIGVNAYEITTTVGGFVIAGYASRLFVSFALPIFLGMGLTLACTRFSIKHLKEVRLISNVQREIFRWSEKHLYFEKIVFVAALVLGAISTILGVTLAITWGVYGGIVFENRMQQQRNDQPYKPPQLSV